MRDTLYAEGGIYRAKIIYDEHINPDRVDHVSYQLSRDRKKQIINRSKVIYDYIEEIQSSIVFGYTAIEAFVNLSIPDTYEYRFENSKGIIEIYKKESIERWLPLKAKLSDVLVPIYNTKPIKSLNIWNKYNAFEEHRNEIIHQKTVNYTNFYKKYFSIKIFELCNTPQELIKFFYDERTPRVGSNALWPWIINGNNEFPVRYDYKSENFKITGNIYEGRSKN